MKTKVTLKRSVERFAEVKKAIQEAARKAKVTKEKAKSKD